MRTHIFNVSAISSADNIEIQMSFFLILFFLPSLNWEREYIIAELRKGGGRNNLKVYLAFWQVPSESIFSFRGLRDFFTAWLEGISYLLVQDSFHFSPEFWRQFQFILSHQLLSGKPRLFLFTRNLAWDSPVRSRWSLSSKLISFFLSISADKEKSYFRF